MKDNRILSSLPLMVSFPGDNKETIHRSIEILQEPNGYSWQLEYKINRKGGDSTKLSTQQEAASDETNNIISLLIPLLILKLQSHCPCLVLIITFLSTCHIAGLPEYII
jgi:hypothetical protein